MAFPLIHASCACDRIRSHGDGSLIKRHRREPKNTQCGPERPPAYMNILLLKSEIGKARPPVYDLPGPDHAYGCCVDRRDNAASVGVNTAEPGKQGTLATANVRAQKSKMEKLPADYVRLNKAAAKDGVVTPAQTAAYRREYPQLVKVGKRAGSVTVSADGTRVAVAGQVLIQMKSKAKLPSDSNPAFIYGKPTRPSTPVAKLVSGIFASQVQAEQRERGKKVDDELHHRRPKVSAKLVRPACADSRKADTEHRSASTFKMKRFAEIGPRVVTRRSESTLPRDDEKIAISAGPAPASGVLKEKDASVPDKGKAANVDTKETAATRETAGPLAGAEASRAVQFADSKDSSVSETTAASAPPVESPVAQRLGTMATI